MFKHVDLRFVFVLTGERLEFQVFLLARQGPLGAVRGNFRGKLSFLLKKNVSRLDPVSESEFNLSIRM